MKSDYSDLEKLAKEKEDENWNFRSFLKWYDEIPEDELEKLVFKMADRVWAEIDCTKCGRCCKKLKPLLSQQDQKQLAHRLAITVEQLREQYLEYNSDDEPGWQTKGTACPFQKDNKCTVYEDRPANCHDYPYLHKPDFISRTLGMIERTFTCPIVFYVMEELKKELGFC